jgi:hypothetical protein
MFSGFIDTLMYGFSGTGVTIYCYFGLKFNDNTCCEVIWKRRYNENDCKWLSHAGKEKLGWLVRRLWCLTPLSTIFQLYHGCGGNQIRVLRENIQLYVIQFVNDLQQVSDFLWVLWSGFLHSHDITEILLKVALNTITV